MKCVILALLAFISIALAQATVEKRPASYPLLEPERQQYAQFGAAEQQLQKALNDLVNRAAQIPVEAQASMQFHAAVKDVLSQLQIISARRDAWLSEQRAGKGCKTCVVEGATLVER